MIRCHILKPFTRQNNKMSDSPSDKEQNDHLNYENCIITHRDDEDSNATLSSVFSLRYEDDLEEEHNEIDPVNITIEQLTSTQLSEDDTFVFVLALLKRVDSYLNNLDDEVHKNWLRDKTNILKTAIVQNCMSFKVDEVRTIDGAVYIKKASLEKNVTKKPTQNKKCHQSSVCVSSLANKQEMFGLDDHPQAPVSGCVNRRRSKRLQEFAQDRQVVLCDKLSYITYKLSPAKFWKEQAQENELKKKNTVKRPRLNKTAGKPGPSREKNNPSHSTKAKAKGVGTESVSKDKAARKSLPDTKNANNKTLVQKRGKSLDAQLKKSNTKENKNEQQIKNGGLKQRLRKSVSTFDTPNKKTYKRKIQSLDMGRDINDTVENQRTKSRKRRAASLSRVDKRVKTSNSTQQIEASNGEGSSVTNGGKRKLYSPGDWLHSFVTMTESKA